MNCLPLKNSDGFTLVELITVMILLAFLSIAFIAYYRHTDTDLITQTHILKSHLRYAQSRAMNTDGVWGVRFDVNQRAYWLFQDQQITTPLAFPGQADDQVDLEELGLDITGLDFSISFDGWGRPALTNRTFTNGQLTLHLNRSGTNGETITLTENTGFIP